MSIRASLLVLMLAGCAASAPPPTVTPTGGVAAGEVPRGAPTASGASTAEFSAARPGLRRIGYRNCGGFAMELFAPARVSATSISDQALYLRAYSYRGGGAIQTRLPGAAARIQQQTGSGWRDLPMVASGSATAGGALAKAPLAGQLGQASPLAPGRYRLWLGQFQASRAGASCAMSPVWHVDIG